MNLPLRGKVAIVTGGSSGVGRAVALAFAEAGARVLIADMCISGGLETLEQIEDMGKRANFLRCDVSNSDDVQSTIRQTLEIFGHIDVAFHGARSAPMMPSTITECTEATWEAILRTNLRGAWLCMKHELPYMQGKHGASIVNYVSDPVTFGLHRDAIQETSAQGIIGLTKAAALEYAGTGVRINVIHSCAVDLPKLKRAFSQGTIDREQLLHSLPTGRLCIPDEIAKAVVWLCTPAASFVTGTVIEVSGGNEC